MMCSNLDTWIQEKFALDHIPSPAEMEALQMDRLKKQIDYVRTNSAYGRELYKDLDIHALQSYSDLPLLPFTDAGTIESEGPRMVCVAQSEVKRIVTLYTSGSSNTPKRLYFSEADLELTVDFFARGMETITGQEKRVMIFMPCSTDYGIGDLLAKGLLRYHAEVIRYGLISDYRDAAAAIREAKPDCVVGAPVQMLRLAEETRDLTVQRALLSSDYVPVSIRNRLKECWNADTYLHYGLTETGYGCAVDCACHTGQHIRLADLLLEVVDPETLLPCPYGTEGEIVLSTLTRQAMPLIRYRTGDRGLLLSDPCGCGSSYLRLGEVRGRIANEECLPNGQPLTIGILDEILFHFREVLDYRSEYNAQFGLNLRIYGKAEAFHPSFANILKETLRAKLDPNLRIDLQICDHDRFQRENHNHKRLLYQI